MGGEIPGGKGKDCISSGMVLIGNRIEYVMNGDEWEKFCSRGRHGFGMENINY